MTSEPKTPSSAVDGVSRAAPRGAGRRCRVDASSELGEIALPRLPKRQAGVHARQRRKRVDGQPHGGRSARRTRSRRNMRRFRIMSLNDNAALLTALANDLGYENVFAEQLKNLVRAGDVLIVISASGNSPNVLRAMRVRPRAVRGGRRRCSASTAAAPRARRSRRRRRIGRLRGRRGRPPRHQPHARRLLPGAASRSSIRGWCERGARAFLDRDGMLNVRAPEHEYVSVGRRVPAGSEGAAMERRASRRRVTFLRRVEPARRCTRPRHRRAACARSRGGSSASSRPRRGDQAFRYCVARARRGCTAASRHREC